MTIFWGVTSLTDISEALTTSIIRAIVQQVPMERLSISMRLRGGEDYHLQICFSFTDTTKPLSVINGNACNATSRNSRSREIWIVLLNCKFTYDENKFKFNN